MSSYSTTATNPPKSLTELEMRLLLSASGSKRDDCPTDDDLVKAVRDLPC
jgi:hypothetical protein